jgi:hypothetical protein
MNMFSLATSLCRLPSRSTLASTCTPALGSHRSHPFLCFITLLVAGLWIMEVGILRSLICCKSPILVAQLEAALHYTTHDKVKHIKKVFQSHMTLHFLFNQRSFENPRTKSQHIYLSPISYPTLDVLLAEGWCHLEGGYQSSQHSRIHVWQCKRLVVAWHTLRQRACPTVEQAAQANGGLGTTLITNAQRAVAHTALKRIEPCLPGHNGHVTSVCDVLDKCDPGHWMRAHHVHDSWRFGRTDDCREDIGDLRHGDPGCVLKNDIRFSIE